MKVSCQATCQKCYHELGRRQDLDVNDLVWHCTSCNRIYLCDIGLARLGTSFSCPFDHTVVIKEEVDKSMIKKEGIPGANDQKTEDLYHKFTTQDKKSKKKTKKHSKGSSKILNTFLRSKISELNDIDQLTIPFLLQLVNIPAFKIKSLDKLMKIKTRMGFLEALGIQNEGIINFLYAALFNFERIPYALETRFAVFIPFILSNIDRIEIYETGSSKHNLHLINTTGDETLVYCMDDDLDIKDIEKLANDVFSIDFEKYPKVKRVFLVANSFSYMAKGLIKKYESALTAMNEEPSRQSSNLFKSIPISIWQPNPRKLEFQNVSMI